MILGHAEVLVNYHQRKEKREPRKGKTDLALQMDPERVVSYVEKEAGRLFNAQRQELLDAIAKGEDEEELFRIAKRMQWTSIVDAGDADRTKMLDSLSRMKVAIKKRGKTRVEMEIEDLEKSL